MRPVKPVKLVAAHYRTGRVCEFELHAGKIVGRRDTRGKTALVFGPSFLDLQCNGFAGIDLNSPNLTVEDVQEAVRGVWRSGCAQFLPTVITHTPERLDFLLRTLAVAAKDPRTGPSMPGFHLEGPFISPADGARGAHLKEAVHPISTALWKRWQKAADGRIALVTLAPELKGALPFIHRLREEGILPAIGHTEASSKQVHAAAEAGALLSTHLGNGCAAMLPRHSNPILAQLGCDALTASLIADGIHLPPEVLRVFTRSKGVERTILVTDSMAAAAASPGRDSLGDLQLQVGKDRVVRLPGGHGFAGSALTMDQAIANFADATSLSLADAWDAAATRPRRLLKMAMGDRLKGDGGIVIAGPGAHTLQIRATLLGRRVLWARASMHSPS
jgi:N-acetylglucosamine-6-phosphate deacetylase